MWLFILLYFLLEVKPMKNGWDKVARVLDLVQGMGSMATSYECTFNAHECKIDITFMEDAKLITMKESVLDDMKEMVNKRNYVISRIEVDFGDYLNLVSISFMDEEFNDSFMNNCCCGNPKPEKADLGWNK